MGCVEERKEGGEAKVGGDGEEEFEGEAFEP